MTWLPLVLWIIAVLACIAVIVLVVRNGKDDVREQTPVAKSAIVLHFITLVLAMAPYVVYIEGRKSVAAAMRSFYAKVGWISGIVLIVLIAVDLFMMYRQASHAAAAQEQVRKAKQEKQDSAEATAKTED